METGLIIGIATGIGVFVVCLLILLGYLCYRKLQEPKEDSSPQNSVEGIDNISIHSPNIIMTKEDRSEDLFSGKVMPFGVRHSSMTNLNAIDNETGQNLSDSNLHLNGINRQSRQLSVRSVHSVNSVYSNAPSFSEHVGSGVTSMNY